jgi:hypothetical protein
MRVNQTIVYSNSIRANPTRRTENIDDSDSDEDEEIQINRNKIPQSYFNDLLQVHNHNVGHGAIDFTYERLHSTKPLKWNWKGTTICSFILQSLSILSKNERIKTKNPFITIYFKYISHVRKNSI